MAYIALYRNYRPNSFSDVVGQKHIVTTLQNSVKNNHISHAYLFTGQRGVGKTTLARILAKAINCLNSTDGSCCNECQNCKEINNNTTTDIIELDAASNNGVDEIRALLEKVNYLPAELKKKVYIIDEVHMLSTSAFNALLKTLEEPPVHVVFILATTEPHKIPSTILSRCQRFDFLQLETSDIVKRLRYISDAEHIDITDEALYALAMNAEGGMRDAISTLDQISSYTDKQITEDDVYLVTGHVKDHELIKLINSFYTKDSQTALSMINELITSGKDASKIVGDLIQCCRDILLYKTSSNQIENKNIYNKEEFIELAKTVDNYSLFYYIDVLLDTLNRLKFTNSQKLYLEVAILKIIAYYTNSENINERLVEIEKTLQVMPTANSFDATDLEVKVGELNLKMKKVINEIESLDFNHYKEDSINRIKILESRVLNGGDDELIKRLNLLESALNTLKKNQATTSKVENNDNTNVSVSVNQEEINQYINEQLKNSEESILKLIEDIQTKNTNNVSNMEAKVNAMMVTALENQDLVNRVDKIKEKYESLSDQILLLQQELQELNDNMKKGAFASTLDDSEEPEIQEEIIESVEDSEEVAETIEEETSSEEVVEDEVTEEKEENEAPEEIIEPTPNVFETEEKPEEVAKTVEEKPVETKSEEPIVEEKPEEVAGTIEEVKVKTVQDVYNVDLIAQALGDSFDRSLRDTKQTMVHEWQRFSAITDEKYVSIARMIATGQLNAVGYKHLIISFSGAGICNRLMSDSIHPQACEVINAVFGTNYDFIALPENTWQDIREQYRMQYSAGFIKPLLKPINNPDLKVITNANINSKDSVYDYISNLFGEDIVKKEE